MTLVLQLAADWEPKRVRFPVWEQPKIDGVRGANLNGVLTARTLRPFNNKHITEFFSHKAFLGIDGELAAESEVHPLLCSLTTSATSAHIAETKPWLMWHCFDFLRWDVNHMLYKDRYLHLRDHIDCVKHTHPHLGAHLKLVPYTVCETMGQLDAAIERNILAGYEGTIIRNAMGAHKNGRSSPAHMGLLRIKGFIEVDATIKSIIEGQRNENVATLDRLGHTERSTHKENMVPNGMVGAVLAELCEDAKHPITGKIVHQKGEMIQFGAGRMTHPERENYFKNPGMLIEKRMKGQIFPHGVKDKCRFPTFQSLRSDVDTVNK